MTDADAVLRQMIIALGGAAMGLAVIVLWAYRKVLPLARRATAVGAALSYIVLAFLTTEHIHSHLEANDAPLWQLWGGLIGFVVGIVTLYGLLIRRKAQR